MNQNILSSKADERYAIKQSINSVNKQIRERVIGQIKDLAKLLQSGQAPENLGTIIQEIRGGLNIWPSEKPYYQATLKKYSIISEKDEELVKKGLIPKLY